MSPSDTGSLAQEAIVDGLRRQVKDLTARVENLEKRFVAASPSMAQTAPPIATAAADPAFEDGFEIFFWKGQQRYRCNQKWESGTKCEFNTHELEDLLRHVRQPHTRSGKAPERKGYVSPVLGPEGEQIIREMPEVPAEHLGASFKP